MSTTKRDKLEATRYKLMRELGQVGPWIQGSLVETARKCGQPSCACRKDGPKHPVLFVTYKEEGKTVSLYVPRAKEKEVKIWAANYLRVKDLIKRMSDLQKQVLRLRED